MIKRRRYLKELFAQNPEQIFSPKQLIVACAQAGYNPPSRTQIGNDLYALLGMGEIVRLHRGEYTAKVEV